MVIPKLGLYIHIPFCIRKCPYCDFYSEKICSGTVPEEYVTALVKELGMYADTASGRIIETVYIGGGTPSLLSPQGIDTILDAVNRNFTVSPQAEISMEANPGTVSEESIRHYREAGINRISLGIQSLNDTGLKTLFRIHNRTQAIQAAEHVAKYFDNFNLDLMHSLPGQSLKDAVTDLSEVISLNPKHISWYQLTIEEDTPYARNIPSLPDEDVTDSIYLEGYELLKKHGYGHYEVSAFAKRGFECRHNLNYWTFGDYLGAGVAAHSKITLENGIRRQSRIEDSAKYVKSITSGNMKGIYATDEVISGESLTFEYFLNRLRLFSPISIREYEGLTGLCFDDIRHLFNTYAEEGLVKVDEDTITISDKGQLFINRMLEDFI